MEQWTREWPTTPGYYWFHGWCFRDRSHSPETHLVRVVKSATGYLMVTDGHFLFKAEGGEGFWLKAELPVPHFPTEGDLDA